MVLALSNEEMKIPKIWKEWLENFFLASNARDKYIINYKMWTILNPISYVLNASSWLRI